MKYFLVLLLLLFSACSFKNYTQSKSKIVTIKTPALKFSDIGYVREDSDSVELELFMAGEAAFKLSVGFLICTPSGCMSKTQFNKSYLNAEYPSTLFKNILLGRTIYEGKNKKVLEGGFEQIIQNKDVNIIYRVMKDFIYFKDTQNKIMIKFKDIK